MMKNINFPTLVYILFFIMLCPNNSIAVEVIEGTYKIKSRELPGGKYMMPPEIDGLLSVSKEYINFNLWWKDKEGKIFSISYVGSYRLTPSEYYEKSIYQMVNDQVGGKGISYDFSEKSGSSPVIMADGNIEFRFPLGEEEDASFGKDKLTVMKPGKFIDNWVKVE